MMREARPPIMERGDFRRRCEAALAHPVTLAAVALLLVNDIVLKALFPGAWAMGKLSDLAWVVFAPPLLAFALSFAVPKSAAGRRTALIIAYGGLPLLYAAFNTFAPVHDAIMRVLLIGAESGALGSPMDASDSLVIPFGIAAAIWAWRRGAKSAGGGTRARFGLLVAGIAAFASVASSQDPRLAGIGVITQTEDGTLIAKSSHYLGVYTSDDGGMSWSTDNSDKYGTYREGVIVASQRVKTPRGEYVISDFGVERLDEYRRSHVVYSTRYLRGDAHKWLRETASQDYRLLETRPKSVTYHPRSGNLIVSLGIEGAVVGTPDGRWHRVAVGSFAPTDFSFFAKTRALASSGWSVGAVALALALSALIASALASSYDRYMSEPDKDIAVAGLTALGCLVAFGMLVSGSVGAYLIALPIAVLTSWIGAIIAASKSDNHAGWKFAAMSCVSTLTIAAASLFLFGNSENSQDFFSASSGTTAFAATIALIPPLAYYKRFIARNWRAFALTFLGMNALIILALIVWLTLNISLPATQIAIAMLVGLAAVVLVRHVRDGASG